MTKRDRDRCVNYLPLLQIVGDLHPNSRMVLLKHLDQSALSAIVHAIRVVFTGMAKDDECYPPKVVAMLKRMVRSNPDTFKTLLSARSNRVSKHQQSALFSIGGSVIATLLSVVVPYVLGQLMKK